MRLRNSRHTVTTQHLPRHATASSHGNALPATLRALRHRNFQLFFSGQLISLIGTWMQSVAEAWLVYRLTGSSLKLGAVGFASQIPVFLVAPIGGIVADRFNRRRVVIYTQIAAMTLAGIFATLTLTDRIEIWHIFVLAALLGVVNAFDIPARQSFLVDMVGKDDLMNAIALNSSVFNATRVFGPAVAGVLIGTVGTTWCFALNGVSYLAVIASLIAMRLPPHVPQPARGSAWAGFRESLAFVRGDPRVSALVVLTGLFSVFGFPFLVLMPVVARDVLHAGAAGYGALTAGVGLGALLGALGVAVLSGRIRKGWTLVLGGSSFGVALALFASSRSFTLSLVLLALA